MIHDAQIEVTCDGEGCIGSIDVPLHYVYHSYSGLNGHYDASESAVEKELVREGWSAKDGKHYCESCSEEVGA